MNNESDMKRGVSSVKRHYNPSILKETLGKQNIMSEVSIREDHWKLGRLEERCENLQSKLTEMESVLRWSSENVWSVARPDYPDTTWELCSMTGDVTAPTLYEALWSAWKSRDDSIKDLV